MPEFHQPLLTIAALEVLITERGYHAEAAYMDVEGKTVMYGAHLTGPRGNKHFLVNDRQGRFSRREAVLWCDGVDYATNKTMKKQADRKQRVLK